jgi:hypothetical protein
MKYMKAVMHIECAAILIILYLLGHSYVVEGYGLMPALCIALSLLTIFAWYAAHVWFTR